MKKLFLLLFVAVMISCSDELKMDVATAEYMHQLNSENRDCRESDYLSISIGDHKNLEYLYNEGIGPYGEECPAVLCHFSENNVSGNLCYGCEGQYASLRLAQNHESYFPNLPVQQGMGWTLNDGQNRVIDEIVISGLSINFVLEKRLIDNLKIGTYKVKDRDPANKGVNVFIHWSVHSGQYESGYSIMLDPEQDYHFEITCIDRSNPEVIRLSGNFEGTFVGSEFHSNTQEVTYQKPISAEFSYIIELN